MKNLVLTLLIFLFLPMWSYAQSSESKQLLMLNDGGKGRTQIQRSQGFVIKGKQRKIKNSQEEKTSSNTAHPKQQYGFETPKKVEKPKTATQVVLSKEELQAQIDIIENRLKAYKADRSIDQSIIKKLENTLDLNKKEFEKRYCN